MQGANERDAGAGESGAASGPPPLTAGHALDLAAPARQLAVA